MNETYKGIFRHVLTTAGGFFVTKGYIGSDVMEQGVGALLTIIGIIWSIANKRSN